MIKKMALIRILLLSFLLVSLLEPADTKMKNYQIAEEGRKPLMSLSKRGSLDFGWMIQCATDRDPFDFIGYGCWCGIGGRGTPVDDLDRCCKAHDTCYDNIGNSGVCHFNVFHYVIPYSVQSCTTCEPASYYWFFGRCRNAQCECDATAALCFANTPYNQTFKDNNDLKCE